MLYRSADVDVYSNLQPISQILTNDHMNASKKVIEEGNEPVRDPSGAQY